MRVGMESKSIKGPVIVNSQASGYHPEAGGVGGGGGIPQPPPPVPPDCSPEAIASAGSGADPRCLTGGEPDRSVAYPNSRGSPSHWQPLEHPNLGEGDAGSGLPPDGLEPPPPPPPPPPHPYPSYVETPPGERPEYGECKQLPLINNQSVFA